MWIKFRINSKTDQIESIILVTSPPLSAEKSLFDVVISVTCSVFIESADKMKLADKIDMDKISAKFESDQIRSLILVTSLWLLTKPLCYYAITKTPLVLIGCSLNGNYVDMDEISNRFKNWPDPIVNLNSYVSLFAEKAFVWLCQQYNSFSFDRMCLKLRDNVDMDKTLDKFGNGPDRINHLRVTLS